MCFVKSLILVRCGLQFFVAEFIKESFMWRSAIAAMVLMVGMTCVLSVGNLRGDDAKAEKKDGWIELFNGKDLTGWGYKSGEKFDGKTESDDKRYSATDGEI